MGELFEFDIFHEDCGSFEVEIEGPKREEQRCPVEVHVQFDNVVDQRKGRSSNCIFFLQLKLEAHNSFTLC